MAEKEGKLPSSSVMEKDGLQEYERIITTKRKRKSTPTRFVPSDEKFRTPTELFEVPLVYLPVQEWSDLVAIGRNFVSHILIANAGEDIMEKIVSFGQTCACDVYIVSAIGLICRASIYQRANVWTYEVCNMTISPCPTPGLFSIISLTGHLSSTVEHNATVDSDTTITLMNKDGSSFRGIVCGPLFAAGEIQIVLWTCGDPFLKTTSAPGASSEENPRGKGLIIA